MVDVKKVTAVIRKPILYAAASASVTNEVINFNPADNPIVPETASTVYTIDPFALFTQEDSKLKVKIPYSRFYRIKYVINPTNTYTIDPNAKPDQFSIAKPILTSTESVVVKRLSYGVSSTMSSGVYYQDGAGFIIYDPIMSGVSVTGYNLYKNLIPASVEGIVELYAGDELTFEHTRVIFKNSKVFSIISNNVLLDDFYVSPIADAAYGYGQISLADFPSVSVDPNLFRLSSGFFFEISEITDL